MASQLARTVTAVFVLLALPCILHAQTVRGDVLEQTSETPVDGALILLLDEAGEQQAGSLSDRDGRYSIPLPASGTYRLQALRIGYATTESPVFHLSDGEVRDQRVTLSPAAVELEGIAVRADRRCRVRPEEGLQAATLWEQARAALTATAWAQQAQALRVETVRYQRQMDPHSMRVRGESSERRSGYSDNPFVSVPVEQLVELGFVEESDSGRVFHAPDARTMLSDAFQDHYCFRARAPDSHEVAGMVGLAFEPAGGRRAPPGIEGTLWLDRETAELHHLEFRYTNLGRMTGRTDRLGGRVEFERLPSGAWVVPRWWIRMPVFGEAPPRAPASGVPGARPPNPRTHVAMIAEEGGEITDVRDATGGRMLASERATLAGEVFDSVRAEPLPGATVFLDGTQYTAETDDEGHFRLDDLPDGEYTVGALHPRADSLGVRFVARTVLLERGAEARTEFATPSLTTIMAATCPDADDPGTVAVVGEVHDAAADVPLPGATVEVVLASTRTERATADAEGRYLICGVPSEGRFTTRATFANRSSADASVELAGSSVRHDVSLATADPRTVAGRLLDWEDGTPVSGATVRLSEAGLEAITDAEGRFRFEDVLPGSYALEVQHLGYGTQRETVRIEAGMEDELHVRLPSEAIAIEGVDVEVRSRRDVEDRARGTRRDVMTRAEIADRSVGARHVGDLARRFPGITSREITSPGSTVSEGVCIEAPQRAGPRRGDGLEPACRALLVVIDNAPMPGEYGASFLTGLPLQDVESIEHLNRIEARGRYGPMAQYGAIVVYTRGNGPYAERSRR